MTDKELGALAFAGSSNLWSERLSGKDPNDKANWPSSEEILVAVGKGLRSKVWGAGPWEDGIRNSERERCAKIADTMRIPAADPFGAGYEKACKQIAAAIRRGE